MVTIRLIAPRMDDQPTNHTPIKNMSTPIGPRTEQAYYACLRKNTFLENIAVLEDGNRIRLRALSAPSSVLIAAGIVIWIAVAVGIVVAFRFLVDWNRKYRELWLDRERQ